MTQPYPLVALGNPKALEVTVTPANADSTLDWSSDNPSVVSVDSKGVVTAVSTGNAHVTVRADGVSSTCRVWVQPRLVPVGSVALNRSSAHLLVGGGSSQLVPIVSPPAATDPRVSWSSSDASVVAVDPQGVIRPRGPGQATITVTTKDGGKSATSQVTVDQTAVAATGVSISPAVLTDSTNWHPARLVVTVTPSDATNTNVTWQVDPRVATVDAFGVVNLTGPGATDLIATTTDGGYWFDCPVVVTPGVTSVALEPSQLHLTIASAPATLIATVSPAQAPTKTVDWASTDTSVVTVGNGVVTPVGLGVASVTATSWDGGFVATCRVEVR